MQSLTSKDIAAMKHEVSKKVGEFKKEIAIVEPIFFDNTKQIIAAMEGGLDKEYIAGLNKKGVELFTDLSDLKKELSPLQKQYFDLKNLQRMMLELEKNNAR